MSTSWHQQAVALTGTMGSGKSTVAELFARLGAYVVSADELAREAVKPTSEGLGRVAEAFGQELLLPDGSLDRKLLGHLVFQDPLKRKRLEDITHPIIRDLAAVAFKKGFKQHFPLYVYDCPLLFEAELEQMKFKKIILVSADNDTCISRIMKRDGLSQEEAEMRLQAQYSIEKKKKKSDIIIDNSSSLEHLAAAVNKLFIELRGGSPARA